MKVKRLAKKQSVAEQRAASPDDGDGDGDHSHGGDLPHDPFIRDGSHHEPSQSLGCDSSSHSRESSHTHVRDQSDSNTTTSASSSTTTSPSSPSKSPSKSPSTLPANNLPTARHTTTTTPDADSPASSSPTDVQDAASSTSTSPSTFRPDLAHRRGSLPVLSTSSNYTFLSREMALSPVAASPRHPTSSPFESLPDPALFRRRSMTSLQRLEGHPNAPLVAALNGMGMSGISVGLHQGGMDGIGAFCDAENGGMHAMGSQSQGPGSDFIHAPIVPPSLPSPFRPSPGGRSHTTSASSTPGHVAYHHHSPSTPAPVSLMPPPPGPQTARAASFHGISNTTPGRLGGIYSGYGGHAHVLNSYNLFGNGSNQMLGISNNNNGHNGNAFGNNNAFANANNNDGQGYTTLANTNASAGNATFLHAQPTSQPNSAHGTTITLPHAHAHTHTIPHPPYAFPPRPLPQPGPGPLPAEGYSFGNASVDTSGAGASESASNGSPSAESGRNGSGSTGVRGVGEAMDDDTDAETSYTGYSSRFGSIASIASVASIPSITSASGSVSSESGWDGSGGNGNGNGNSNSSEWEGRRGSWTGQVADMFSGLDVGDRNNGDLPRKGSMPYSDLLTLDTLNAPDIAVARKASIPYDLGSLDALWGTSPLEGLDGLEGMGMERDVEVYVQQGHAQQQHRQGQHAQQHDPRTAKREDVPHAYRNEGSVPHGAHAYGDDASAAHPHAYDDPSVPRGYLEHDAPHTHAHGHEPSHGYLGRTPYSISHASELTYALCGGQEQPQPEQREMQGQEMQQHEQRDTSQQQQQSYSPAQHQQQELHAQADDDMLNMKMHANSHTSHPNDSRHAHAHTHRSLEMHPTHTGGDGMYNTF
ncbi:hypothetical protein JB92DRAFT_2062214 [Gautieria morchelliformis]|nr:hypothetical protein JB92DRAFT_2062214 [Gautieria morchelliformis]